MVLSESQLHMWNSWKTEDMAKMGESIIASSQEFLEGQGWMYMVNLNDGYLYSRMSANHVDDTPLGQQVGDMIVKFEYVECGQVNVLAQQMQDDK